MEDANPLPEKSLEEKAREAEDKLTKTKRKLASLESKLEEIDVRAYQMKDSIGLTSLEVLKGCGAVGLVVTCVVAMGMAFCSFEKTLLFTIRGSAAPWAQSHVIDRVVMYGGQATIAPPEWPGSSLVWAAGLGFVALVLAIGGVALGAIITLSRIGRHSE